MPVEWTFAADAVRLAGHAGPATSDIAGADARRQSETAAAIVDALRNQPGMILADEVGMGKTYVALAVIASVLASTRKAGAPVVVMVPPGLLGKWRREWQRFKAKCLAPRSFAWMDGRDAVATTPTEFFKLLDDLPSRNARLIFVKTSCFGQGLVDPWIKLALVRYARSRTKMTDEQRKRIYKWAGDLTLQKGKRLSPDLIGYLLSTDPTGWKPRLVAEGVLDADDDDPVPQHLDRCKDTLDYRALIEVLRNEIPGRSGAVSKSTLKDARQLFNGVCQGLYWQWLACVKWKASLLVLDEAHHAKNDSTRLAGLFRSEDMKALVEGRQGAEHPDLWQKADRMLFLTATPFQLGHDELIRVLKSFAAVSWLGPQAPSKSRQAFLACLDVLKGRLNDNRLAGRRLDSLWGRMSAADVAAVEDAVASLTSTRGPTESASLLAQEVRTAIAECRRSKLAAERDSAEPWNGLAQWVVRHNRPTVLPRLPTDGDGLTILRRAPRAGIAIHEGAEEPVATADGLSIAGASALPFLLAARAQAELAGARSAKARAFFAEGLSSSYEAFHHTRDDRRDVRDDQEELESDADAPVIVPLEWYEEQIAKLIPQKSKTRECFTHPKVRAVVERAVRLWLTGEKVLIFAFYSQTVKALRDHLRREVDRQVAELARSRLAEQSADESHAMLVRVSNRFGDEDSPFHKRLAELLDTALARYPALSASHADIKHAVATYVRSPAFIARFMPLEAPAFREAIQRGEARSEVIQAGVAAFVESFNTRIDGSGMSMGERVHKFLDFANDLAMESQIVTDDQDEDASTPLAEYLDAVLGRTHDDDDDGPRQTRGSRAFGVVRAVLGETKREVRERLMLAFNSPLFPELLVSSGVLAEGVDLHRFCRHLIHHDLCWNPSSLEQRTGRLDRIHCKAEVARRPIVVYLPFIGGSADEKMFRVVRDRERWFQVVMGQKFELDERTTEKLASRVPLPPHIASELLFDLRRWREA